MTSNRNPTLIAALLTLALTACQAPSFGAERDPGDNLPPEKQAILAEYEQMESALSRNPAPQNRTGVPPAELASDPEPEWTTGIIEGHPAPFPQSRFHQQNQWQEVIGGLHVNVYAGSLGRDPFQGAVIVQRTGADLMHPAPAQTFLTPQRAGAVRIISASGNVLTLRAETGDLFTFDATTLVLTSQ
jgi:hypothetical protein